MLASLDPLFILVQSPQFFNIPILVPWTDSYIPDELDEDLDRSSLEAPLLAQVTTSIARHAARGTQFHDFHWHSRNITCEIPFNSSNNGPIDS